MRRRDLFRRAVSASLGATFTRAPRSEPSAHLREFPQDYDASRELARTDWKPEFLSVHQHETLELLSDRLIPETETPGARQALVSRFIDHLLARSPSSTREEFIRSLSYIDGESRSRHGAAFVFLNEENQLELLTYLAYPHGHATWGSVSAPFQGHAHFENLKDWISRAFYSSEIGMRELGWDESPFHEPFSGCQHPKGTHSKD